MKNILIFAGGLAAVLMVGGCADKETGALDIYSKTEARLMKKPTEKILKNSYVNVEKVIKLSQALAQLEKVDGKVYMLSSGAIDFDIPSSSYRGISSYDGLKKYIQDSTGRMYDIEISNNYFDVGYKLVNSFDKFEKNKKGLEHKSFNFNVDSTVGLSTIFRMVTEHTGFNITTDNFIKQDEDKQIVVVYKGDNIKGLLDYLSSKLNIYYDIDYEKKIISFSKFKFKLFSVLLQNEYTKITQTTSLSQANLGASSADAATATTSTSTGGDGVQIVESENRHQYEFLDKELSSIFMTGTQLVGGDLTTMTTTTAPATEIPKESLENREYYRINPMAGTVAVFASPGKMAQAEKIIKNLEESANKNISVKIKLYKVKLNRDKHYGINWSYLATKAQETVSLNSNVFSAPNLQNYGNLNYMNVSDSVNFEAVLSTLSEFGNSELVDTFDFLMSNNTIDYRTNAKELKYIAEVKQDTVAGTATTAATTTFSVTQSDLKYGTFVMVSPRAIAGKINIKANLIFSNLLSMDTKTFGDDASNLFVQQPFIEKESKKINMTMNSGERYIVSGFMRESAEKTYSGLLPSENAVVQGVSGMNDRLMEREEYFITVETTIL
ncbi:MAG: hypothetical protein QG567_845 [Campylobacterota bacterium]|nr:hypothetical protein [Campylobacterota bacterium]